MHPLIATPATALLVYRAYSRRSLTPTGILTAALTAIAHAYHPWSVFYALLAVFFLAGTAVTKVKHEYKATLTRNWDVSSEGGGATGEGAKGRVDRTGKGGKGKAEPTPRTAVQVLCNSLPATLAIILHAVYLQQTTHDGGSRSCLPHPTTPRSPITRGSFTIHDVAPLLPYAILAHYAAAAADTFSSELGILSSSNPVLITSLLTTPWAPERVPKGTNGGVTLFGTLAGLGGAAIIGLVVVGLTPFCSSWTWAEKGGLVLGVSLVGPAGSVLDSLLGAWCQASVVEKESGLVVENSGGGRVIISKKEGGKKGGTDGKREMVVVGRDWLSNNGVNLAMCSMMSLIGMGVAWSAGSLMR